MLISIRGEREEGRKGGEEKSWREREEEEEQFAGALFRRHNTGEGERRQTRWVLVTKRGNGTTHAEEESRQAQRLGETAGGSLTQPQPRGGGEGTEEIGTLCLESRQRER